jgi:hypothetical protein
MKEKEDIINFLKSKKKSNRPNFNTGNNVCTPFSIKKMEENYTFGKCMYLAIALKDRFGYEINMKIGLFGKDRVIEHAWSSIEKGKDFDIEGYFDSNKADIVGEKLENVSKKFIYNLLKDSEGYADFTHKKFEKSLEDANKLIDNYLIYAYPKIQDKKIINKKQINKI